MKLWCTEIKAICPIRKELITFCGPEAPGVTWKDADNYCQTHGLGYCYVIGELIAEIPCKEGTFEPDFKNIIDYENTRNN